MRVTKNKIITIGLYILYVIFWSIYILKFNPTPSNDLYRHYQRFKFFDNFKNLVQALKFFYFSKGDIFFYIYIYILKNMGLIKEFLPISIMTFYSLTQALILIKTKSKCKINESKLIIIIFTMFFLLFPFQIISTLRNPLAITFFCVGFLMKKQTMKVFLYLLAVITHIGLIIPIIGAVMAEIFYKKIEINLRFIYKVGLIFIVCLLLFKKISFLFYTIGLSSIGNKFNQYLKSESIIGIGFGQLLYYVLVYCICLYFILKRKKISRDKKELTIFWIAILCIYIFPLKKIFFLRTVWLIIALIPYILKKYGITKTDIILILLLFIVNLIVYRYYILDILMEFFK